MLTNCLAVCAHLIITVSEIERDICEKNRHFIIADCIRRPRQGGSRRNIANPFGMEKLEWWGYPKVKKEKTLRMSTTVQTEYRCVTDGQADILPRHSPRYAYESRGKKFSGFVFLWTAKIPVEHIMRALYCQTFSVQSAQCIPHHKVTIIRRPIFSFNNNLR